MSSPETLTGKPLWATVPLLCPPLGVLLGSQRRGLLAFLCKKCQQSRFQDTAYNPFHPSYALISNAEYEIRKFIWRWCLIYIHFCFLNVDICINIVCRYIADLLVYLLKPPINVICAPGSTDRTTFCTTSPMASASALVTGCCRSW